ncbi:transposase [Chryseobacterium phosphatilyticum]|uniref:Transposase n=1 Tax=Chryseobacterium phosphatilyticum TaxID=475075 RepID=A0A316X7G8_9FLAO|nr:transposase [Chryseobacterium phosphatilyticum]PWN68303.1 transposase [Chryseobacterium phosphatilyticum]
MKYTQPHYKKIYTDIIMMKYPEKFEACKFLLQKEKFSALDVIKLDQIIFGNITRHTNQFNQRHKSYDQSTILKILEFQKENGYNNSEMGLQFKISRNSLAKWKKMFLSKN